MPRVETEPHIVADVCLTVEADQTVRAILEPEELEYSEDGVRLDRGCLDRPPAKPNCGRDRGQPR
jgi:hypothetical protein